MIDDLISDNMISNIILVSLVLILFYVLYMIYTSISNLFSKIETLENEISKFKKQFPKEPDLNDITEEPITEEPDLNDITEEPITEKKEEIIEEIIPEKRSSKKKD